MLTIKTWFGILLTVIRKERMMKNQPNKLFEKKLKKLLTTFSLFGILLNVNRKEG